MEKESDLIPWPQLVQPVVTGPVRVYTVGWREESVLKATYLPEVCETADFITT